MSACIRPIRREEATAIAAVRDKIPLDEAGDIELP